jgi:hypothetical protein
MTVKGQKFSSNHETHRFVLRSSFRLHRADMPTISQDRHRVAKREDFWEPMRNVKDAHPVGLKIEDDPEKNGRLGFRQAGGWFIQNQQPRISDQTFADLDELLLGHGQCLNDGVGIVPKSQPVQNVQGRGPQFLPIEEDSRVSWFEA